MKSLLRTTANRRQLMAGGAWTAAAAAVGSGTAVAGSAILPEAESVSVVLHDRRFALAADIQQRLNANGAQIITLTDDPVRMWRSEVGRVLGQRDTRLLGITRWPEFLLVSGLAAESRRHVRYQRLDAATGAMTWLIY